jgi:hypothetical protein
VAVPTRAPSADRTAPAIPPRELAVLLALVGSGAALYLLLAGHRWDYLGHFAAGAGLALLAVVIAHRVGIPGLWAGPLAAAAVIVLSAAGEAFLFSYLVFDWADIGAGGLGASLVAAWCVRNGGMPVPARAALLVAAFLTVAGFVLRFGFDQVGTPA